MSIGHLHGMVMALVMSASFAATAAAGADSGASTADAGASTADSGASTADADASTADAALSAATVAGVHKIDATHYRLDRPLIERVLSKPTAVAATARLVPAIKDGKPVGIKVYGIRPGTFFDRLGLKNGDTLNALNHVSLSGTEGALEAYSTVRQARKLALTVTRHGERLTLHYRIVKHPGPSAAGAARP